MKLLLNFTLVLTLLITGCAKEGCTDSAATNYDSDATSDDGSCTFPIIAADLWTGNYMVTQSSQNISAPFLPVVDSDYSIVISKIDDTTVTIQNLIDCSSLEASVSETSMVPFNLDECDIISMVMIQTADGFTFESSHGELDVYETEGAAEKF